MVNGTVQISLADIDKLRQDVKEAQAAQLKAENELVEVRADKRVMKVTKFAPVEDIQFDIDESYLRDLLWSNSGSHLSPREFKYFIRPRLPNYLASGTKTEKTEFVNFDDVKAEIRKVVEAEVNDELGTLRVRVNTFQQSISELTETNARQNFDTEREHQEDIISLKTTINELKEAKEKLDANWQKKYTELETGKKEEALVDSLLDEIKQLKEALEKSQNRKWYQRF